MLSMCGSATDSASACCRVNPTGELRFDGTTLHPYDAMFVKMKRAMVQAETPAAISAMRYQQWMGTAVEGLHAHGFCVIAGCKVIVGSQEVKQAMLTNTRSFLHARLTKGIPTCNCFHDIHSVSSIIGCKAIGCTHKSASTMSLTSSL